MEDKRKPVWLIVLAVIFFPITLVVLLVKLCNTNIEKENKDEAYQKAFPPVMANDDDSDEAKEIDDYMFMDLMDEEDEKLEELEELEKEDEIED